MTKPKNMPRTVPSGKLKKIKIAYIFNCHYFLGGGEISFYELIKSIDRSIIEPLVIVPEKGDIEQKIRIEGLHVIVCPFPSLKMIIKGAPVFTIFKLIKIFNDNQIEIIHANGSRSCFYAGLSGRLSGIPVIWHVRETIRDYFLYDMLLGSFSKNIICVSKSVEIKRFGRFGHFIKKKIVVVYNGVDTSKLVMNKEARDNLRRKLNLNNDQILFGLIGNIIPLKGQDFFLLSFAKAKKKVGDISANVLIIGHSLDIPYKTRLNKLIMDNELQDNVVFEKFSENIIDLYSAIDVFVLSSQREGFSRSLIESMSFGLPILASNLSEIEEAVEQNKNAILINYNNTDKMASAIIKIFKEKSIRDEMGKKNRQRVVEFFDLKVHANIIERLYSHILSS
jgi:L-malate glycosyltransferase